jgi:tRNA G18 (ribose-2'-O)-methylase SpoU
MFVAEGLLVLRRLLATPYRVRSVLVTRPRLAAVGPLLDGGPVPLYAVTQETMNAVTGFNIHRGILAIAERRPLPAAADLLASARRVAVLEAINDHENLGVIFRNAAAFSLDAVLLSPDCCDPLYRRSVRVSMGHALAVPYARLDPWPGGLALLRGAGFWLVALTPGPEAADLGELPLGSVPKLAYLLGAEGPGLSAPALGAADLLGRIPMAAGVDSLNVASAAAVAFYAGLPAGAGAEPTRPPSG